MKLYFKSNTYQTRCKHSGFGFVFLLAVLFACKKEKAIVVDPEPIPPKTPKVSFVFVNRNGFRNDSTRHGVNDTVLGGVCLDGKYYDKSINFTTLTSTCYNRNFPANNYPLTDSILLATSTLNINSKTAMQVEIGWNQQVYPYKVRIIRYVTKNWPSGDTIKIAKDTVIKFIWPLDTNSGRFIKTFQWP